MSTNAKDCIKTKSRDYFPSSINNNSFPITAKPIVLDHNGHPEAADIIKYNKIACLGSLLVHEGKEKEQKKGNSRESERTCKMMLTNALKYPVPCRIEYEFPPALVPHELFARAEARNFLLLKFETSSHLLFFFFFSISPLDVGIFARARVKHERS